VEADPARLQQVLWNLIKNAVKFTPARGALAIRTRNEAVPGAGERLVLEGADTGIGNDPEMLPRVFDGFEQAEEAQTRQFGGLGLGLAISRTVVEAHGGRLSVSSAGRGLGATFALELAAVTPAVPGTGGGAGTGVALPPRRRALRILLVEDDLSSLR